MPFSPEPFPQLQFLGKDMLEKMSVLCDVADVPAQTEILKEGAFVRAVPVVLTGLVKVFTRQDDKELLLYYIKPSESCVMSLSAGLQHAQSKVYALTEEDSSILLIPAEHLGRLIDDSPALNRLFYNQFDQRYIDMLETIQHLLFDKLDKRLLAYLKDKLSLSSKSCIQISHREMAANLGTAREVVTRILKKLEKEGKLRQGKDGIELTDSGD